MSRAAVSSSSQLVASQRRVTLSISGLGACCGLTEQSARALPVHSALSLQARAGRRDAHNGGAPAEGQPERGPRRAVDAKVQQKASYLRRQTPVA
jgi:hypothetical protein